MAAVYLLCMVEMESTARLVWCTVYTSLSSEDDNVCLASHLDLLRQLRAESEDDQHEPAQRGGARQTS